MGDGPVLTGLRSNGEEFPIDASISQVDTPEGKLFAGLYAMYAGLFFLILAGFLLAPAFHRILHRFHWETEEDSDTKKPKR